jgi:hypothetical protein
MGEAAPIGAVGIGAIVLTALYWMFGFLRMGTTGLTSQAIGAGDRAEADALLTRALMIAFAGGAAIVALQVPLFAGAFLIAPASDEVESLARDYMAIRVWSAPALIALYGITGWLIAAERTRAVLVIQLVMNGVNVVLNLWFVLGLGWGVPGVAVATFVAEWLGFALGLWFCRDALARGHWRDWPRVFDAARLRRMAGVNGDILIRSLLLEAIFVSFLFLGAGMGDVRLAANQVLLQFLHVTAYAMDGFAFGAETLVGQAMGARAPGRTAPGRLGREPLGHWHGCGAGAGLPRARAPSCGPDDHGRTGARGCARLPALDGPRPASGRRALDARRHLHRRHPHPRHAQHDASLGGDLCRRRGSPRARLRQPRALGGAPDLLRRPRHHAGLRYPALEAEADRAAA